MPLHKPKVLPAYHQQLSYCITQVRVHGGVWLEYERKLVMRSVLQFF